MYRLRRGAGLRYFSTIFAVAVETNSPGSAPLYYPQPGTYGRIVLRSQRSGSGRSKSVLQRATACHSCAALACLHTDLHEETRKHRDRDAPGTTGVGQYGMPCVVSSLLAKPLRGVSRQFSLHEGLSYTGGYKVTRPWRSAVSGTTRNSGEPHEAESLPALYLDSAFTRDGSAWWACCQTERNWSGESIRLGRLDTCAWYLQLTLSDRAPHHQTDIEAAI